MGEEDEDWEEVGDDIPPAPEWPAPSSSRTPSHQINCSAVYNIRPEREMVSWSINL